MRPSSSKNCRVSSGSSFANACSHWSTISSDSAVVLYNLAERLHGTLAGRHHASRACRAQRSAPRSPPGRTKTCLLRTTPRRRARRAAPVPAPRGRVPPHVRSSAPRRPSRRAGDRSTDTRGSPLGRPAPTERGILMENRLLQCGKLGTRVQAELRGDQLSPTPRRWRAHPPGAPGGTGRGRGSPSGARASAPRRPARAPGRRRRAGHPTGAAPPGGIPPPPDGSPRADTTRSAQAPSQAVRRTAVRATAREPLTSACAARSGSPSSSSCDPRATSRSNVGGVEIHASAASWYPIGVVSMLAGAISAAQSHDASRDHLRP